MADQHSYQEEYGVFFIPADTDAPMEYKRIGRGLEDMRALIGGGWIEVVRTDYMPRLHCGCRGVLVVDEEGLIKGLPHNLRASVLYPWANGIFGDAFLIGEGYAADSEGDYDRDFISLPPEFNRWEGPGTPVPTPEWMS